MPTNSFLRKYFYFCFHFEFLKEKGVGLLKMLTTTECHLVKQAVPFSIVHLLSLSFQKRRSERGRGV